MYKALVVGTVAALGFMGAAVAAAPAVSLDGKTLVEQRVVSLNASGDVDQRVVSLAGIDLNQPAGAALAYRRIERAARSVCRNFEPTMPSTHRQLWTSCVEGSIARAVTDVGSPALTAYSATKSGTVPAVRTVAAR